MARILVKTKDAKEVQELRQYGKIVFLSSLVDVVGVETTEAEIEKIKGLFGEERVRHSARGTIQKV
ncbi:MAG: hypothetical protein DDT24_00645 [Chloroflexi bacterium]|nr:hypothetical protein [Chloroflexota bacterium]